MRTGFGPLVSFSGCHNEAELEAERKAAMDAQSALLDQQKSDIQACRDHGGVPVTEASPFARINVEQRLIHCDFPCAERRPAEKP